MAIHAVQETTSTTRPDEKGPVAETVTGRPRSAARKLHVVLLAWSVIWTAHLVALDPAKELTQYRHDVWQDKDGLPQNSIRAMVQTRDGYLWLGTYEGLVRFDGIRFTVFDTQNTPVLKNNTVQALLEGKDGSLWIGTNGGGVTRLKGGVFDRFLLGSELPDNIVLFLFEDHSGRIWVGTESGGLGCFTDGSMQVYRKERGLPGSQITSITEDVGHNLWIGTFGDGLGLWKDGRFTADRGKNGVPGDRVTALLADPATGKIWVGTWGHGVYGLQDGRLAQKTTESQSTSIVSTLYEDLEGNLWVGMNAGGASRLRNGEFSTFSAVEGLSHKSVWAFCQDREGSLWIGTNSGLHRFRDEKFTTYLKKDGLPDEFVRTVYEDRGGNVWIGTIGGLTRLRDGQSTTYTERDGLPKDHILSLHEDGAGSLWIGTRKGLGRLTGGKFRSFQMQDGLSDDNISCIWEDREGALWVGTRAGLNCLRNGRFRVYTRKDGLASDNIMALWEARDGALWVGSRGGGLTRLKDNQFTTYDAKTYPFLETVFSFYEDDTGSLWIGTSGSGLVRFKEGRFTRYTTENGLADNTTFQILDDGLGRLWLTSNKGLSAVSKSDLMRIAEGERRRISAVAYDTADGMPSRQCNGAGSQPAGWRSRDGRLWIPTARGIAILDPAHILTNRVIPPVQIESVTVDGRALRLAGRPRLAPGVARIEFEYTALSFVAPEKVRFRYWLEGFDKGWVEAGTRRVVSYTTLAPGAYRFRITACNNDGVWNETGATFEFELLPRFYQTVWFLGLCAMALLFAGWGGHQARIWRLKERETELVRVVGARTEELAEMNRRLERLSYQDGLTGVANRRLFDDALEREWRRSRRVEVPISLIMIDIDFFKRFNDAYGHLKGDECLKSVASALRDRIGRPGDLVARYGGEEFVIILPGTDSAGAVTLAERLRATVEGLGIRHESSPVSPVVTVSVGVATADLGAPHMQMSSEALVNAADRALFRAKEEGRNRVCRFEAEPPLLKLRE